MSEVTSYLVTGNWLHLVDDSFLDEDAYPDLVLPWGHVRFIPVSPAYATAGSPAVAYTFAEITAPVVDGALSVSLAGSVGDFAVRWRAETSIEYFGKPLVIPTIEFDLLDDFVLTSEQAVG